MTLKEIESRAKIARAAGMRIEETDYGWTVGAWNERLKKGTYLSRVYRPERDGASGGWIITEEALADWIKENPA